MRSIGSGEEVRDEELVQLMADGTRLWLRCDSSPIYDDEGRIVAGVLVMHDLTEQNRAVEDLRESHRQIEDILESVTDAYFTVDRDWRFTHINKRALVSAQEVKGEELTREDLLGKKMWEVFPEGVGTTIYQRYHEAKREQKTVHFEALSPVTDGWIEVHAYPSEEGLSVYYQDITERKQAEKELETRTHQQAVVADFGLRALVNDDLQLLMDEAVVLVARTLEAEYSEVVEILSGGEELLIVAGVGWEEGGLTFSDR